MIINKKTNVNMFGFLLKLILIFRKIRYVYEVLCYMNTCG